MSADNILVIVPERGAVAVYDCNFSDVSSHPLWGGSRSEHEIQELVDYIKTQPFVHHKVFTCPTKGAAEGFCTRYRRLHVVEYGVTSLCVGGT